MKWKKKQETFPKKNRPNRLAALKSNKGNLNFTKPLTEAAMKGNFAKCQEIIAHTEKLKIDEVFRATTTRRPNAETPVALAWHLGMGRTGAKVLKRGTCKREWHDGAEGIVGCIGENAAMFRTCSRQNEKITQTQACGFSYRTCSLKLATATTTTAETTGRKGSPSSLSLSDSSYSRTSNGKE